MPGINLLLLHVLMYQPKAQRPGEMALSDRLPALMTHGSANHVLAAPLSDQFFHQKPAAEKAPSAAAPETPKRRIRVGILTVSDRVE